MAHPLLPPAPPLSNYVAAIHILTARGEALASKVYRTEEAVPEVCDLFFRLLNEEERPPFFQHEGIHFAWVTVPASMIFFTYSRAVFLPAYVVELLLRLAAIIGDFLGELSEAGIRRNLFLVLELLDEILDDGYVQTAESQVLKSLVSNEPLSSKVIGAKGDDKQEAAGGSCAVLQQSVANRSFLTAPGRCDICIDIVEKANVTFLTNGQACRQDVIGQLVVKSFFSRIPSLQVALNPSLVLCSLHDGPYSSTAVLLARHNIHKAVCQAEWEQSRVLQFTPTIGTMTVLSYRVTERLRLPFRITVIAERMSSTTAEILIRLQPRLDERSAPCTITMDLPLPKDTLGATSPLEQDTKMDDSFEFRPGGPAARWVLTNVALSRERLARCTVQFSHPIPEGEKVSGLGPVSLKFSVIGHTMTGLAVQSVELQGNHKMFNLRKWTRNWVVSGAYTALVGQC